MGDADPYSGHTRNCSNPSFQNQPRRVCEFEGSKNPACGALVQPMRNQLLKAAMDGYNGARFRALSLQRAKCQLENSP